MKSDTKIEIIIIIFGITLSLTTVIYNDPTVNTENIDMSDDNLRLSKVSARIHIDNNWTEAKAAGICIGEGTYPDPYIIEDLIIDAGGSESGILIENSNEFFRIENVTIYSALNGSGIELYHATNGRLSNNNCTSNKYGIRLWNSHNNTISGNIVYNNKLNGMDIWNSNNNSILENIANNNNHSGWDISNSNNNSILENIAYKNKQMGISLWGKGNNILGNTLNDNNEGMVLSSSSNNTILRNSAYNNTDKGIWIYNSDNNSISGNTASYNKYGIFLTKSKFNIVSGNTANNNSIYGMVLDFVSSNNEISENIIHNNRQGLKFYASYYNSLYLNSIDSESLNVLCVDSDNYWNSKKKIIYTYKGKNFTNYLGNYWSDYNGVDANNDGIGDTPYMIGEDKDNYPLMDSLDNYIIIKTVERSKERIPGYNLIVLLGTLSVGIFLLPKRLKNP